ncbi:MAG: TonB-dependent receptor domain-containing protein [Flavobacteriales bacterium]
MTTYLVYGQSFGTVLDEFGQPIDQVSVFFADQNIMLMSDVNGRFFLETKIPNNSVIQFYKLGFSSKLYKYKEGEELRMVMKKLHVNLDEVGVSESYSKLGNNRLMNIDKKTLDNNLVSTTLSQNVSKLSGVDVISSGQGIQKLVVRGLSGLRVVTYLNGMKIENQQWGGDHGIGFTDLGLNNVELIKGSSALKYGGEAVGGLLYFNDYPFQESQKLNGFLASKLNSSNYLSSNQIGLNWFKNDFYFTFYSQYAIASDYKLPNNQYLFNSRFRKKGLKFSISKRFKNWNNVFRYQYNGEDIGIPAHTHDNPSQILLEEVTLDNLILSEDFKLTRPNQFIDNHLFIYETNYFLNEAKLSVHLGHFVNNLKEFEKWTVAGIDLTSKNSQLTTNYNFNLKNFSFNLGSQISRLENQNNVQTKLIPDAVSDNLGLYSIVDYEKKNIGFNAGVRYDNKELSSLEYSFEKNFTNLSYSSGVYVKKENHLVRATFSTAFRAPHLSELFSDGIHHGSIRYEIGDVNLTTEKGSQFDLKYQYSDNHFGIVVNPFLQYIDDFISITPTDSSYQNSYRYYLYDQYDMVTMSGVECNIHYHPHQLHNLHIEQSYSFLNVVEHEEKNGIALLPANKVKTKLIYHLQNTQKSLKISNISLYHVYAFEQNNFAQYEEYTPAYNVVNVLVNTNLSTDLKLSFGIDNLLNKEYTPHISRLRNVADGVPNPGRSYNVNLKYNF